MLITLFCRCSSRTYLLRQLKILGMNAEGLKTFYCSNIRSLLSYVAPAWCTLLGDTDSNRLEKTQHASDFTWSRSLPILARFLLELSQRHFSKIASDSSHPLFSRIMFNSCRMSSRNNTLYRPQRCRTQKRAKSFFQFFLSESNKWFTWIFVFSFNFFIYVHIQYYRSSDRECLIKWIWIWIWCQ